MISYTMATDPAKLTRAKKIGLDHQHRERDVTHGEPRQNNWPKYGH